MSRWKMTRNIGGKQVPYFTRRASRGKSGLSHIQWNQNARPHPNPLPQGEGEAGDPFGTIHPLVTLPSAGKRNPHAHEPRGTSNIEHPTPNIEWQIGRASCRERV